MTLEENKNFASIALYYKDIGLNEILSLMETVHFNSERQARFQTTIDLLDENDYIEHVFLINKNHPAGPELHCVTHSGIIFILNQYKYENNNPCLITILLARPNQIKRLYDPFGFKIDEYTLNKTRYYIENHLNN